MTETSVRRATSEDAQAIADVHRLSRADYYGATPDPGDGREALWARLLGEPGRVTHVAERIGSVVAFLSAIPLRGPEPARELTSLYVLPEEFGRGTGSRLHEVFLRDRGPEGWGVLEVWAANDRAIDFYRHRGWVATPTTRPGPRNTPFVIHHLPPEGIGAATVRAWHDEEGWGVVESEATPGGCWVHMSAVMTPGPRSLDPGTQVWLVAEAAEQDGFGHRAIEVWPIGATPVRPKEEESGSAYRSSLSITLGDPDD